MHIDFCRFAPHTRRDQLPVLRGRRPQFSWLVVAAIVACPLPAAAADPDPAPAAASKSADEEAVRNTIDAYRKALDARDPDAIAAFWTAEAEYVDQLGRAFKIHERLEEAKKLAQEEGRIRHLAPKTDTLSIRLITPDVALEDGGFQRTGMDASHSPQGRYTAVWVKRNGKWLIEGLRESPLRAGVTAEPLRDLAWMIGDWSVEGPQAAAEVSCTWGVNKTYIVAQMKMLPKGAKLISATQLIGWDPLQQRVRSFLFDSRGGFVEGVWTNEGDAWVVHASGVLPDGKRATATKIYTQVDDNTAIWESIDDQADGQPGVDVRLKMTRKPAK